jgi:hypothetical protein
VPEQISSEWQTKFAELPGFVSITTDGDSFVCAVRIAGDRRRMGAQTLQILYDSTKELIKKKTEKAADEKEQKQKRKEAHLTFLQQSAKEHGGY